jgi:hypothetical protein
MSQPHQRITLKELSRKWSYLKMVQSMKGNGINKTERMEEVFKLGLTVVSMKDIGKMIRLTVGGV